MKKMHRVGKLFQVEEFAHTPQKRGNILTCHSKTAGNFVILQFTNMHAIFIFMYLFFFYWSIVDLWPYAWRFPIAGTVLHFWCSVSITKSFPPPIYGAL